MSSRKIFVSIYSVVTVIISACSEKIGSANNADDGTIVFNYGPNDIICTMSTDGSNKQPIGSLDGTYPKYSPDGKSIALYHWFDNPRELWLTLYSLEHGSLRKLGYVTKPGIPTIFWFSWSRDGSKIVFSSLYAFCAEECFCSVFVPNVHVFLLQLSIVCFSPKEEE